MRARSGSGTGRQQHDVGRLQVAMNHAVLMRLIEGIGHLNGDAQRFVRFQRAADWCRLSLTASGWCRGFRAAASARRSGSPCRGRARLASSFARNPLGERFALEVLHDDELDAALAADVVEDADVGMFETTDRLRLAFEALLQVADPGRVGGQDLDRDGSVEACVAGLVDFAHATGAGELEDFVRSETRACLERYWGLAADYAGLRSDSRIRGALALGGIAPPPCVRRPGRSPCHPAAVRTRPEGSLPSSDQA